MNAERKKQLRDAYQTRPVVGGVYAISCAGSERRVVRATNDIAGIKNRFEFGLNINGCPDPAMRDEWLAHGTQAFSLDILEELKKKEDQTDKEFNDEIALLLEIWQEKTSGAETP